LSSTTESRAERGQALVVFTLALVALLLAAALAFDVGMMLLEKREQQNAADAAALAGVRYLPLQSTANSRATAVANANGFASGGSVDVQVSSSATQIRVTISNDRQSIFARVVGIDIWPVQSTAVAVKMNNQPPFASLLALSPDACPALLVSGTGVVTTYGDVHVNSSCESEALKVSGQGNLHLFDDVGCYVVGGHHIAGRGDGSLCDPPQEGSYVTYPVDGAPPTGGTPQPPQLIADNRSNQNQELTIPSGCPGSDVPATDEAPATCQFQANYSDTVWRLFPGYYPGGIKLQGGTFYLDPGIYYLAGGGLQANSTGVVVTSTAAGDDTGTLGGGVMFFNTTHPNFASGDIRLGGNDATFNLHPNGGFDPDCDPNYTPGPWERYLIYQDPAVTLEMVINGGSNEMVARGLIIAPTAHVKVNGGTGTLTLDAIIAYTFQINGNEGNINILYDNCALPTFTGYGLVI
jgi:Flp pilus assembly protein TadG